eukprot:TRINITY_DN3349_c1_g1_i3.p1 TRINITY_DN3349_c1_g1~~TRINITY_DN3349_c1_g1_i3.p1  ORF type:complete len:418 (-),score=20.09 TRINITY_DN3349_c1_g1_i3:245-1498(-)
MLLFERNDGEDWCNPSFECDIMTFLCNEINNNQPCLLKMFDSLDERVTSLETDKVDIVVSRFSVTPERAERVDFVRPYYLSSGAQLFVRPEDKKVITSFDLLTSFSICMDTGYYVSATLADQYGLVVFPSKKDTMFDFIDRRYCIAAVSDSVFSIEGLVPVGEPKYVTPYGVAVAKNSSQVNLNEQVQQALLKMFVQKNDTNQSLIQYLYQEYLEVFGFPESKELQYISAVTTDILGDYIGQDQEDEIWQAANLSATEDFNNRLFFADPTLEEPCLDALEVIYDSYANGTQLDQLPVYFQGQQSFSIIFDVTDDVIISHPFVTSRTNGSELEKINPQYRVLSQIRKTALEENPKDGDFYYALAPVDPTQYTSNFIKGKLFSPTRVMSTFGCVTMHGRGQDIGHIFQVVCSIGQMRDW